MVNEIKRNSWTDTVATSMHESLDSHTLKEAIEYLQKCIEKYGEDAFFSSEWSGYEDYDLVLYKTVRESDESLNQRIAEYEAEQEKRRQQVEKDRIAHEKKVAETKAAQEAMEREMYEKLRAKFEGVGE